jgi:heme A synthase
VTVNRLLLVAALVLFVIAALGFFAVFSGMTIATALGLTAAGLACWAASALT